jgi:short-subunit dehydrogenase
MTGILITGASSGLGEALALAYAAPGTTLFLSGRDAARLGAVAEACRAKGATVDGRVIDVADAEAMAAWITEAEAVAPLALVIANAGISGGTGAMSGETAEQARAIFKVNMDGVVNAVLPALPFMRARRAGQVVLMASLVSFRGFPTAPAYSASKAMVRVWGEGLRGWLAGDQIKVNVVCPGFVRSRITARNRFPMPFLMEADKAAALILRGIEANKPRISFPWPMAASMWLLAALPPGWTDGLLARFPKKV